VSVKKNVKLLMFLIFSLHCCFTGPKENFRCLRVRKTISYTLAAYGTMKTTVSSKGQIVLPAELRQRDGIEAGQEFDVERLDCGDYRLKRRASPVNEGVVDWLLACPEKGFFVPIESESTDTL
jgi:AbrB family looped-hinge helix DNA binding protein